MTKDQLMIVCIILIEWMQKNNYYDPSDSNEPVALLKDLSDFLWDNYFQQPENEPEEAIDG